jgi:hypothetical protein
MEKLANARALAINGDDYLKTLEEETSLLNLQVAAEKERLSQAQKYQEKYAEKIGTAENYGIGSKLEYDEDGRITNYQEI